MERAEHLGAPSKYKSLIMKVLQLALFLLFIGLISSCNRKTSITKTKDVVQNIEEPQAPTLAIDGKMHGKELLSLERMPCRGTCPWDRVTFYEDGVVFYVGSKHVKRIGRFKSNTASESIQKLINQAEKIGYFKMASEYPTDPSKVIVDLPITRITVDNGSTNKEILFRNDSPKELISFVQDIVSTTERLNFQPLSDEDKTIKSPKKNDHGTLVMTIKRAPCFGSCPWYEASFYDDGTILYEGKKHVNHIGKFKLKANSRTIRTLTNKAQKIGFFKMEKEYPVDPSHQITDLPKTELMVKIGRTGKTILLQNEIPPVLIEYIKEIEGTLKRLDYPE